jgi:hypothetical protein
MGEQPGIGPASQRLYRRAMEAAAEDPALAGYIALRRLGQGRPEDAAARAELEAFEERHLRRTVDQMLAELGPNPTKAEMSRWLAALAERARRELEAVQEQQRRAGESGGLETA